jgi:hypothetical protein
MFAASKTDSVSAAVPDAQFNYVTMLLHGDGTNGSQNNTFLDSSTNNFTITRNGNTTQGSFSPYGSNWSNFFLNTIDSNRITWPFNGSAVQTAVAGTNYTLEFWVFRLPFVNSFQVIFSTANDRNNIAFDATNVEFRSNGGTQMFLINANTYIPLNTWTHVALVCSGTTWTLYFNGTSYGTYSGASKTSFTSGTAQLGGRNDCDGCGYLSNFRVSTVARYSGNFTPSTTPFTSDASTAMLTCQSNRFIDVSSNAQALTANGDMSVQRFNPFGTSTAYSTSVIGGSGYFDGSGDYIDAGSNSAFAFGTGTYTVEAWVYVTGSNTENNLFCNDTTNGFDIYFNYSNSTTRLEFRGGSNVIAFSGVPTRNSWAHVALVREGTGASQTKLYFNGVLQGSGTDATNWTVTGPMLIGGISVGAYLSGYISDARIVKGTAVYTAAFTPPTAPLSAITNTSLLTNFTNGAIFDNAMMNDLETVGNAQISTSVKKYGTGSLAFDGTGDYLVAPVDANQNFNFGTGDFTVEMWFYANSLSASNYAALCGCNTGNNNSEWGAYVRSNGVFFYGASATLTGGGTVATSTWYHFAATRSGTTIRVFLNGVQQASATTSGSYINGATGFRVGDDPDPNNPAFNGYIDDLRITKGYARYTTTFTPPTAAFSDTGPI